METWRKLKDQNPRNHKHRNMLLKKNQTTRWHMHTTFPQPKKQKHQTCFNVLHPHLLYICFPATVSSETRRFTGQYSSATSSSRVDLKELAGSMRMGTQKARRWCSCCLVWPNGFCGKNAKSNCKDIMIMNKPLLHSLYMDDTSCNNCFLSTKAFSNFYFLRAQWKVWY